MGKNYLLGLIWILVAGAGQGSFALPMKFMRRWKWEHVWLVYSFFAFILLPLVIALLTVPSLGEVYAKSPARVVLIAGLFGGAWGVGSVFFGLGVDALGMALGFSIMTGLYTALGALIPLLALTPDLVWTRDGLLIVAGNAVTIIGVIVCAVAGDRRDKQMGGQGVNAEALNPRTSFATGMAICVASGVFSAAFNFSYAFGKPIAETAQGLGASPKNALNALWLIALPAGGIVNIGYCLHLARRRKSWELFWRQTAASDWVNAAAMAVLWTGSVIVYGWGADLMGRLGPSLGWSLWNAFLMLTTLICGLLTREWAGASANSLRWLIAGIAVLILGAALLGVGGAGA